MTGFIIDLDGTMYAGKQRIEGAAEFAALLQKRSVPHLYLTNNSSRMPEEVAQHLSHMTDVGIDPSSIMTSAQAAARYVAENQLGPRAYVIGESGLLASLRAAGIETVSDDDRGVDGANEAQLVVQGIDRRFDYAKLKRAIGLIGRGAPYVLTNPDLQLPADGELHPGAGSISASIAAASGVEPIVVGKPSPIIMDYAIERLGLPKDRIWVVGDNLRTDIGAGIAAGCRTALVLTGLAQPHNVDEQMRSTGIRPERIYRSLTELEELLEG